MPPSVDPNSLTLALVLTAGGAVAAAALITGVVQILKQVLSSLNVTLDANGSRLAAFILSAILVIVAYIATAVTINLATGFAAFLAWYGIARLAMTVYDDATAKTNSLRGPVSK